VSGKLRAFICVNNARPLLVDPHLTVGTSLRAPAKLRMHRMQYPTAFSLFSKAYLRDMLPAAAFFRPAACAMKNSSIFAHGKLIVAALLSPAAIQMSGFDKFCAMHL
jgi:hypothetical protein